MSVNLPTSSATAAGTTSNAGRHNDTSTRNQESKMSPVKQENPGFDPWAGVTAGKLFSQRITASSGSTSFTNLVKTMRETLKEQAEGDFFDVVAFPKEVHTNLHFSVISIVRHNRQPIQPGMNKHVFITVQNLLVESTGDSLRPYTSDDGYRGRPYTVTPTSEDVHNKQLTTFIEDQLLETYKDVQKVYQIDPVIVRRTMVLDTDSIKRLLEASTVAVESRTMERHPEFRDFNYVAKLGSNDLVLPVTVDLTGGQTMMDVQGMPYYADAVIGVSVEQGGKSGRGGYVPNSNDLSKKICEVGAMVELVNVDPELLDENKSRRSRQRDFVPQVAWAPRIVVTAIEQYMTRTPSGIFFAVASIAELGASRLWARTFRGTKGGDNNFNLRDLGYLNIEANLGDEKDSRYGNPINTSPNVFDDRDMAELLDSTVTKAPMFAVDCPTTGPSAYYTTLLYRLARGTEAERRAAHNELARSLRDATDGLIDNYINLNAVDLLEDDGEMLYTGFWLDQDNKQRDIRELDNYLAIASRAGAGNADTILGWCNTWNRGEQSEAQALSERLTYLQSAAAGTVTVQGTALRVTLNAEVVAAFSRALAEGRLPLVSRQGGESDQFQSQRSVRRTRGSSLYQGGGFGNRDSRASGGVYRNRNAATRV